MRNTSTICIHMQYNKDSKSGLMYHKSVAKISDGLSNEHTMGSLHKQLKI